MCARRGDGKLPRQLFSDVQVFPTALRRRHHREDVDDTRRAREGRQRPRASTVQLGDCGAPEAQSHGRRIALRTPTADRSGPADLKYITRSVARCLKRFKRHGVAAFTPHDLRRTGRTGLARLGVKVDIAERVLNHARERIEANSDGIRHPDKSHVFFWSSKRSSVADRPPACGRDQ